MKNSRLLFLLIAPLLIFIGQSATGGLLYPYSRLALKDLDQMSKLVLTKIQESKKSKGNRAIPLKEALQAVYSRPNSDFMIEKVISPLKNELEESDLWEPTLRALVKEALGALKNPKAFAPEVQGTYAIFLENFIAEAKPRARDRFEREILAQIRSEKIELTKEAQKERRLRMMTELHSPSLLADEVLKSIEAEEAAAAKAEPKVEPKTD